MEFEGTVFRKLPEVTGTSAKGAWRKQDVVFEMPGEFSRKICVTFFGDRAEDAAALNEGETVNVSVNVESREYNGKWYTDVKAWKITRGGGGNAHGGNTQGGSGGYGSGGYGAGSGAGYGTSGSGSGSYGGGSYAGGGAAAGSHYAGAPFNESSAPASPADEVDDLPF